MSYKFLRVLRVLLACCVLLTLTSFFLDFDGKIPTCCAWLAKIQLLPALAAGSFVIFATLVVLTALFGRIYCSVVCPLGILQDAIAWVARLAKRLTLPKDAPKTKRGRNYRFRKNHRVLRIFFVLFALLSLHLGGCYFGLIEPYGIFGRIVVNIFKPIYVLVNNGFYAVSSAMDKYWFYYVDLRPESVGALIVGIVSFVALLIFAGVYGRLYCNTVCPIGSFLGLISRFALCKTHIDASRCVGCGLCAKACKSSCIDVENKKVDSSRCVVCFDCFSACRKGAISYGAGQKPTIAPNEITPDGNDGSNGALDEATLREKERVQRQIKGFDRSKRNFVALSALAATAAIARVTFGQNDKTDATAENAEAPEADVPATDAAPVEAKPEDYGLTPFKREFTISPPGSVSHKNFQNRCVGCHLCVAKCPSHVLKPSGLENGLAGFMQPRVDFTHGFCNYDCTMCGDVCPAGAILPMKPEDKKLVQMGHVVFIKENCIVYAQDTSCGACSEHCPTQAVHMVPYGDKGLTIPETDVDLCVGCGGCEYICPARPFRAIYIEGNPVHQQAKPVEKKEAEEVKDVDFGF